MIQKELRCSQPLGIPGNITEFLDLQTARGWRLIAPPPIGGIYLIYLWVGSPAGVYIPHVCNRVSLTFNIMLGQVCRLVITYTYMTEIWWYAQMLSTLLLHVQHISIIVFSFCVTQHIFALKVITQIFYSFSFIGLYPLSTCCYSQKIICYFYVFA